MKHDPSISVTGPWVEDPVLGGDVHEPFSLWALSLAQGDARHLAALPRTKRMGSVNGNEE